MRPSTFVSRIKTTYRFVNMDKPDEFIDMVTFAEGIDSGDKGSGKAMTYGDKYALMKAYKISTGDDPDQNASEETHYSNARTGNFQGKKATPREMLIARLNELHIDVNAYAKANGLNGKTSSEYFTLLLSELNGEMLTPFQMLCLEQYRKGIDVACYLKQKGCTVDQDPVACMRLLEELQSA